VEFRILGPLEVAGAVAAYHDLRQRLAEDLGVDPSPQLREAYQHVLARNQAPDEPGAVRPAQVPAAVADFTGRELEVKELRDALTPSGGRSPTVVISAVTGVGGIGKSALAAHVAHLMTEAFPDGRLYANLMGASPGPAVPADVQARLMRDLGVSAEQIPATGEERDARYRSVLAGRKLLLFLDDARDAAQLRPLLPGTEGCAVLITSRARLADLPGVIRCDLAELTREDAGALFARIVGPDRAAAEPAAVTVVLDACGELPLAIRIAAARLAARPGWSIADLAARLAAERDRLRELRCGDLAVRTSFQLSFDELDEQPARVFRLLGLTPAGLLPLAAVAALADMPAARTEQVLDVLADVHLIENPAPGSYRMHDLLRLFAAALRSAGQVLSLGRRLPPGMAEWSPEPDVELPALRTHKEALGWIQYEEPRLIWAIRSAAARGWHELVVRLASPLAVYGMRVGDPDILAATQRLGVDSAEAMGDDLAQAWLLSGLGMGLYGADDYRGAIACFERVLALRQRAGDRQGEATAYCYLANAQTECHLIADGLENYRRSAAISEELGDDVTLGMVLDNIGQVLSAAGDVDGALDAQRRAVDVLSRTDHGFSQATARNALGETLFRLDRVEQALEQYRSAESMLRELGMAQRSLVEVLCGLGEALAALDRADQARASWVEAAALAETGVTLPEQVRVRIASLGQLLTIRRLMPGWTKYEH
jgi:tetratricopeptide (TPR) repeat protein